MELLLVLSTLWVFIVYRIPPEFYGDCSRIKNEKTDTDDYLLMDKTQRNAIKQTFKNYRNMTSDVRRTLASIGIQAEKRKKHWILR